MLFQYKELEKHLRDDNLADKRLKRKDCGENGKIGDVL
jgi:hypothetical protein